MHDYFSKDLEGKRPVLTRCSNLVSASGLSLLVRGSAEFTMQLGSGLQFNHKIVVANIENDGLLGNDVFRLCRAEILYCKGVLGCMSLPINCRQTDKSVPGLAKKVELVQRF